MYGFCAKQKNLDSNLNPELTSSLRAQKHIKDKPDMLEANSTYLWQTPSGKNAKTLYASVPVSLSQTQFEFEHACVNGMNARKQVPAKRSGMALSRPRSTFAEDLFSHFADMKVSIPVPVFFIPENTSLPLVSA